MAKKALEIYAKVHKSKSGNLTVRYVVMLDDGSHPFGEQTADLTNGEKQSLGNLLDKIARKAEA